MVDYAIVTIMSEEKDFYMDMELPINLPIKELSINLLENLKIISPDKFADMDYISLLCDGVKLLDDMTFESEGIWDGSIIFISD